MKLGVLGHQIPYSLSPKLHQFWIDLYGFKGTYDLLDKDDSDLKSILASYDGLNVTIPYKQKVLSLADKVTPRAKEIGAVNTLYKLDNLVVGDNTDYLGVLDALQPYNFSKRAMVLGDGGAAGAVKAVFNHLKIEFDVYSRRNSWGERHDDVESYDIIINTTPLGLNGLGCPLDILPSTPILVVDMVYLPIETPLLKSAKESGHYVVDGLELLIRQAHHSFYKWWGVYPDINMAQEFLRCSLLV